MKLTKRSVEGLTIEAKDYFVWDSEMAGFGVRVFASGRKSYLVQYRASGRSRRKSIGRHGVLTADEARTEARKLLGDVAKGGNPAEERQQQLRAPHTDADKAVNGKSGRTTSVTLGKMPGRQVIIYDKRAEVIARSKTYWWAIWNDTLRGADLPLLRYDTLRRDTGSEIAPDTLPYVGDATPYVDATMPDTSRIWRIEFRAGKDCLKDTWGIRTWGQLFDSFGDLIRHTGEVVRYAEPNSDPNRSRWPNHLLWETVVAEMNDDLIEMRSGADPNPMKEVHKETHIALLMRNILGTSLSLAALNGVEVDGVGAFLEKTGHDLKSMAMGDPSKTEKQLNDAKDRYVFMSEAPHRKQG